MGSELYGLGSAMAQSISENEDDDWDGCENPGDAADANILANTPPSPLFKPLPPVVEELPVVIVAVGVVELAASGC